MRKGIAALLLGLAVVASSLPLVPVRAHADSSIQVYRDRFGVAHIEAHTLQGASYAMGYVEASDRLFEMDIFRHYAQGRLAEIVGPSELASDEFTRREFLVPGRVEAQYQAVNPVVKSMLQAYTQGINDAALKTYLDPRTRPALYDILGVQFEQWKPEDSVELLMLFSSDLFGGDGGAGQLQKAALLAHLRAKYGAADGLRVFNDMYPPTFDDAPSIVPAGQGPPRPPVGYDAAGPSASQDALLSLPGIAHTAQTYSATMAAMQRLLHTGIPFPHLGSFGGALSGSRARSQAGLLFGDPQAGLESPPIFYEVGLHIPGVTDCEGITVAGFGPSYALGWCNQHAWTLIAANVGDQTDLYAERLNPANPHQYWFNGAWRDTVQDTETYIVRGITCALPLPLPGLPLPIKPPGGLPIGPCTPQVVRQTYDYTVHGAIEAVDSADHIGFAYRRAQRGVVLDNLEASLAETYAHSLDEFRAGTDLGPATLHQLYADSAGNIAYRLTGLQPIRPEGIDRRFPVPGTGEAEWQGFLSPCAMPANLNPPEGYIAVNQGTESKPAAWWPNSGQTAIGIVARPRHDRELLAGMHDATLESVRQLVPRYLQQDDPQADLFYPLFAHALAGTTDPRLQQAQLWLERWRADGWQRTNHDHAAVEDHPGLALFEMDDYDEYGTGGAFATPIGDALIQQVMGGVTDGMIPGNTYMGQLSAVYQALTHRLSRDYVGDTDALLRSTILQVMSTLSDSKHFGTADMSRWHDPWPSVAFTVIGVNSAPAPIQGFDHGSYAQIVDLGLLQGEDVEPPGNIASDSLYDEFQPQPHGYDQRDLYQAFQYKPMRNSAALYRTDTESVSTLSDGGSFGSDTHLALARAACRGGGTVGLGAAAGAVGLPNTGTATATAAVVGLAVLAAATWLGAGRRRRRRRTG